MGLFDKITGRVNDIIDEVMIPDDVHRAHEAAMASIQRGQFDEALNGLRALATAKPNIARTHYLMGRAYMASGDLHHAADAYEVALGIRAQALTHVQLGAVYEELLQWREAEHHYQSALDTDEKGEWRFDAHFGLGRTWIALGRLGKAIKELRHAETLHDSGALQLTLAQALYQRGLPEEALEVISQIGDLDALEQDAKQLLTAQVKEACGDLEEARAEYEGIIERPNPSVDALMGAARLNLKAGHAGKADTYCRQALAIDNAPTAAALTLRGRALLVLDRAPEAIKVLEAALAESNDPATSLTIGDACLATDNAADAVSHFEAAMSGSVDIQVEAGLGLGRARRALGDLAGARLALQEALRIGSGTSIIPWVRLELAEVVLEAQDPAQTILLVQETFNAPAAAVERLEALREQALERLKPAWKIRTLDDPLALSDILDQLIDHAAHDVRLTEFVPAIQRVASQLESPLALAIVGEFNAGKSTIVNALIGEQVLPTGVLPTTAHSGILKYGPRKAARVFDMDGSVKEVSFAEAKDLMKSNAEDIEHLEFVYPHPALRAVEYWDTPGFNAVNDRHEEVALRALATTEAILWVMDANQVLSQTEFDLIDRIPDAKERLLVVINKVDRLGPLPGRKPAVDELMEYIDDNLEDHMVGAFAISALGYWEGDEAAKVDSGFGDFEAFLDAQIVQRAGRIKVIEGRRNLGELVGNLTAFQEGLRHETAAHLNAVETLRNWLHEEAAASTERAKALIRDLDDQLDFMLTGIEAEIAEAMRPSTSIINSKFHLAEEDRRFLMELIEERLGSVLDHALAKELEELGQLESAIALGFDPILKRISLTDARALQGRLDGFYDESQTLQRLLADRVYGQIRAETHGRVDASGNDTLSAIVAAQNDRAAWRAILRRLIPRLKIERRLTDWYVEYFENAYRLLLRVRADLELTQLEAKYRYDFEPIQQALITT